MIKLLNKFSTQAGLLINDDDKLFKDKDLETNAKNVYQYLSKFKIGPKILLLLVVFAFPKNKREKIWIEAQKIINYNK